MRKFIELFLYYACCNLVCFDRTFGFSNNSALFDYAEDVFCVNSKFIWWRMVFKLCVLLVCSFQKCHEVSVSGLIKLQHLTNIPLTFLNYSNPITRKDLQWFLSCWTNQYFFPSTLAIYINRFIFLCKTDGTITWCARNCSKPIFIATTTWTLNNATCVSSPRYCNDQICFWWSFIVICNPSGVDQHGSFLLTKISLPLP